MFGTDSPTSRRGRSVVAGEESVRYEVKLCPHGWGGRVLLLVLARNQFLRLRKLLLVADWGRAVVNPGHRGNGRYMGDFLARTPKNLKSPSPGLAYLIPETGSSSSE